MTKKDYIKIADIIKNTIDNVEAGVYGKRLLPKMVMLRDITEELCDVLSEDNLKFNRKTFMNYIWKGD